MLQTDFNLVSQTVVGDFKLGKVPGDGQLADDVLVGSEEAHLVLERLAQLLAGLQRRVDGQMWTCQVKEVKAEASAKSDLVVPEKLWPGVVLVEVVEE